MSATKFVSTPSAAREVGTLGPGGGGRGLKARALGGLTCAVLALLVLGVLLPLLWMVLAGFKTNTGLFNHPWAAPKTLSLTNFRVAWQQGVVQFLWNSVIVTVASIILVLAVSVLGAYALTKLSVPFSGTLSVIIIGGMMLSPTVALVPLFGLLNSLGLYNSRAGLVLLYAAYRIPLTLFLLRAYMLTLPKGIDEAARIDGASQWVILWRLIVPLCKPALISAAVLQALFAWNEFPFALVFITSKAKETLPVGLLSLQAEFGTNWPQVLAAMVIAALPMTLAFLVGQRHFIRGLADGHGK